MVDSFLRPDYIFESSWEVCNKVGGIHTVLSTKARTLVEQFGDKLCFIGPDVWRGPHKNPEFLDDEKLFPQWQEMVKQEGIRVKTGRWNIPGQPLVILVDFSSLLAQKDEILSQFWEAYRLDSLSGQWDYVESVLFGFAVGKVIESFYKAHLALEDKVVAHFNEWMTGSGVLYLKKHLPQIGLVFTTHSTVVGRALARYGAPVYDEIEQFDSDQKAREMHVISKHSMEKITTANADTLTTVSDITSRESAYLLLREADVVAYNGFQNDFVPNGQVYQKKRKEAREKLKEVAGALLGTKVSGETLLVANTGRYEYRNKGIDILLDSLKILRDSTDNNREVLVFVMVPGNTFGPRKDLVDRLNGGDFKEALPNPFLTHGLNDIGYDPILQRIQEIHFDNISGSKVKIIFVPSQLDGNDGIFNKTYYDLLIGMDLTVFPSYYEPWGYTPLESIAFGIPTITTSLAGFGIWAMDFSKVINDGVEVVLRNDHNYSEAANAIAGVIAAYGKKTDVEIEPIREKAFHLASRLEWDKLIRNYYKAYDLALQEVALRHDKFKVVRPASRIKLVPHTSAVPEWKKLIVKSKLPRRINVLHELTRNLWWTWTYELVELFAYIDEEMWVKVRHNPIELLEMVSYNRLNELAADEWFLSRLDALYSEFRHYMERDYTQVPRIAYFSMEYGLNDILKIFSGGLGILAGDYLKEASDRGVHMTAVGLLYRYGYFTQTLSLHGEQTANYEIQEFSQLPLEEVRNKRGNPLFVHIDLPGRVLHAKVWLAKVGRVSLYLMDTDVSVNNAEDRTITHKLYGGDWENRLKQEMLLGIGGIRLLKAVEFEADLFHLNEGHAALTTIERLIDLIDQKFSFSSAMEIVRASSLFTTHTPVPAGHDKFHEDLLRAYLRHLPEKLNISWEQFMNMGREYPDSDEKFSMSVLAAKTAQEMNGVSWLHGEVSKKMFTHLWDGYFPEELHVSYVTNGVHYSTWTVSEWQRFYKKVFGETFLNDVSDKTNWEKIYDVPTAEIWKVRSVLRKKLIDFIRYRMESGMVKRHDAPGHIVEVLDVIDEKALTIGFARRFATYKRAALLFTDLERLSEIVNNTDRPVQFIFAGKAHPADIDGQALIKRIVEISKMPAFIGKVVFLENYDMELAKRLVSGVDVWLNTPTRPLEASGTSGQKAELNGVLNFSVLDGWWYEGYKAGAGWSLTEKRAFDNQEFQDELDAAIIYSTFENEIIPLFYDLNEQGEPEKWVKYIKNSIAQIAPEFTTRRMIDDYLKRFYNPMHQRVGRLKENDFARVHELSSWKRRVRAGWDSIELLEVSMPDIAKQELGIGDDYTVEVKIDLKQLEGIDVGLEMLIAGTTDDEFPPILHIEPFKVVKTEGSVVDYKLKYKLNLPGSFNFGIRMFPKNDDLPHKQDFCLVRWF